MPGLVNRWFPRRLPAAMGIYSAALMSGGGLAALLAIDQRALRALAGGAWGMGRTRAAGSAGLVGPAAAPAGGNLGGSAGGHWFGNRRAWLLALYFGLINGGYTSMVAWLPAYHLEHGGTAQGGGELVGLMTVFQVAGALGLPLLLRGLADRRPGLWLALLIQLGGFTGLLLAPASAMGLWVAMIGLGLGACFSLSLTLTLSTCAPQPRRAALRRSCRVWALSSPASCPTSPAGYGMSVATFRRRGRCWPAPCWPC